jgi:hypothetical protein
MTWAKVSVVMPHTRFRGWPLRVIQMFGAKQVIFMTRKGDWRHRFERAASGDAQRRSRSLHAPPPDGPAAAAMSGEGATNQQSHR